MAETYTPMMKQYQEIKSRHQQEILFFRLGDFYEMFFDDAEIAARELDITLTSRDGGKRVPMCGVPYHSAEGYIAKLIEKGYKVAICEQVEDPRKASGIVKRDVVKIITPGTVLSEQLLPDKANNYLVSVAESEQALCFAAADISTGECIWGEFDGLERTAAICDRLFCLAPAEIIFAGNLQCEAAIRGFITERFPNCSFSSVTIAGEDLAQLEQLPALHFTNTDLPKQSTAKNCLAYLLYYLRQTQKNDLSHINRLIYYDANAHLLLDTITLRNLELSRNLKDSGKRGTLFSVLDFTETAMGCRLLKQWIEQPLKQPLAINERLDAVEALVKQTSIRSLLKQQLANIYDLERILTKIEVATANPRDLIALKHSLCSLPIVKNAVEQITVRLFMAINLSEHIDIVQLIETTLLDAPPISTRDGNIIRTGVNTELDELRTIAHDSKHWIQKLETTERETTGIRSLKVGYNRVFGYYIEVTHANSADVPAYYIRKQTLANAERYITPELKEFELKVLGAEEKIMALEYQLFANLRETIKQNLQEIQHTARQIAFIDAVCSLAEAAMRYQYVRPQITTERVVCIKDGRHPVVEQLLKQERFIPNDTELNHQDCETMIITGPNMAGKSTYMRQVALLLIMAQMGSFIPARHASLTPVDRIFTRVGANDDLAAGQSTFMVEMAELSHILKHATTNSLVILDEIGRGTSTYDGMSIARAVIEYINKKIKALTLFSTHYHELTALESEYPRVKNYSVAVKERGNNIVFLRRIVSGGADKSYGIHVAQLAGLPKLIIERSEELLKLHEQDNFIPKNIPPEIASDNFITPSLFASSLAAELLKLDVMTLTPLEALNILYKLHQQAKAEAGKQ